MQTPGLASTPFSRLLLLTIPLLSIIGSSLALKQYIAIHPFPHLWPYLQFWRVFTYQFAYLSSSEVLFATVLVYNLRVLERLFGTKKYVSAILVIGAWSAIATTTVVIVLDIISLGRWGYLPGGATGTLMALLAIYQEAIPSCWRWRLSIGGDDTRNARGSKGIILSDKSTTYILAIQLSLSQFPYCIPPAVVGWMIGTLWRAEVLPGSTWRVPGWMVGESGDGMWGGNKRREFEGLRRRLEDEGRAERERDMGFGASSATSETAGQDGGSRRRGVLRQVGDYFRGAI